MPYFFKTYSSWQPWRAIDVSVVFKPSLCLPWLSQGITSLVIQCEWVFPLASTPLFLLTNSLWPFPSPGLGSFDGSTSRSPSSTWYSESPEWRWNRKQVTLSYFLEFLGCCCCCCFILFMLSGYTFDITVLLCDAMHIITNHRYTTILYKFVKENK